MRSCQPGRAPRRLASIASLAIVAALGSGTSGCYDCLYCDGVEQVDGWARVAFVEAGEGGAAIPGLEVRFGSAVRTDTLTTNASGAVVLMNLAGNTINYEIGLPTGYAFAPPEDGIVPVIFQEDTASTTLSIVPPDGT